MKAITYNDLRYNKEDFYYSSLKPTFSEIKNSNHNIENMIKKQEDVFFDLLSHSIRIDKIEKIKNLIDYINDHLNTKFEINVFLYQYSVPNAMCIPLFGLSEDKRIEKLLILVSQHFLNNLNYKEQTAIFGHELAHLLFGHVEIPVNMILKENLQFEHKNEFKSNVLKWSICCEITCDIFGFVSSNKEKDSFSTAMLKYNTGLNSSIIKNIGESSMINLVLDQYNELSDSIYEGLLSTHPMTPLRLKIIQNIADCELIKNYGREFSKDDITSMKKDYTSVINNTLIDIYPEIINTQQSKGLLILTDMALAVTLADGKIEKVELESVERIVGNKEQFEQRYSEIKKMLSNIDYHTTIDHIVNSSVDKAKKASLRKLDIVNIVRQLIIIAASDSIITKSEFEVINMFSHHFNISKKEIVLISKQCGF